MIREIYLIYYYIINPAEYLDDPSVDDTPLDLDSENNKTVTIRSKSRHLNEDTVYQEANSTVAANETILVSPLQSLSPVVSYSKDSRSFSSLFRTFSFKGIGYCFTKSVVEWQTVGLGKARIPFCILLFIHSFIFIHTYIKQMHFHLHNNW